MQFLDLGLNPPICSTFLKKGYTTPIVIQAKAIPNIFRVVVLWQRHKQEQEKPQLSRYQLFINF